MIEVGSVREIQKQLVDNGYIISQHFLRQWIKHGKLPAAYSGSKALISYSAALSLLIHETSFREPLAKNVPCSDTE